MQGGIANTQTAPEVVSIGRVFYEPLWVFYRGPDAERLTEFKGKRLAVGPEGSGTRALAMDLLKANGIAADNSTLAPLTGQPAVDALKAGQIDAVFLAVAAQAPMVQGLLRDRDVKLMSFTNADAYTKLYPYLARLDLPQGVFDLVANVPSRPVTLIGPQAAIVVRNDLHPAIVALLSEAAQEVHGKVGLFNKAGEFPTQHDPEYEMDQDATRYYKSGPTFWKRVLPFHIANLVERLIVLLVPLATVMIPLAKAVPWLFKYRIRRRIHFWYKELQGLETRLAELPAGASTAEVAQDLDEADDAIRSIPSPVQFAEQFYNLRAHVDLVRQRIALRNAIGVAQPA